MKKIFFFTLLIIQILVIPFAIFTIVNMMVSITYETDFPNNCISSINGVDLCLRIKIFKGIIAFCVIGIISMLYFRNRILKK